MYRRSLSVLAAMAMLGTAVAGSPARADDAAPRATARVLVNSLLSPLSLAVAADGTLFYSENFKGTLLTKSGARPARKLFQAKPGTEVGAVSEKGGVVRFATTLPDGKGAYLKGIGPAGHVRTLADLGRYEKRRNPDRWTRYGFRELPDGCSVPDGYPFRYRGVVDAHPYGTEIWRGTTYVADAAGNTVLAVGPTGRVRTVAVLPAVPVEVTPAFAEAGQLPECTVGATYFLEPVPTDVEEGPDGWLYVSSLPGRPEDGSKGAVGGVFGVNPRNGKVIRVAQGLVSATGVAVGRNGAVFVAELFPGRIVKVRRGSRKVTTVYSAPLTAAVELRRGRLYATTHALTGLSGEPGDTPQGRIVRIRR